MGGKSKSKSSSSSGSAGSNMANAISQVGRSTQAGTNGWLNSLMGEQSSTIARTIMPLIESGQQMMSDNPALANFLRATGGQPMQFETPDLIKSMMPQQEVAPAPAAPQQQEPQWMANLTPEMKQRFYATQGQSPYGFNINNYMRDQNLGGQGGR
jgi:hypothetical protein